MGVSVAGDYTTIVHPFNNDGVSTFPTDITAIAAQASPAIAQPAGAENAYATITSIDVNNHSYPMKLGANGQTGFPVNIAAHYYHFHDDAGQLTEPEARPYDYT